LTISHCLSEVKITSGGHGDRVTIVLLTEKKLYLVKILLSLALALSVQGFTNYH